MPHILDKRYKPTALACFLTSVSNSVTGNLSPLLFLTFRRLYGLSFVELGLLVLINFMTQLLVDLLFSAFSRKLRPDVCVKATPLVIAVGLWVFALCPWLLPSRAFLWLLVGTVIFSAGSGLSEVLTSPTIAAVPSDNGPRLMSTLHASYAWGVVAVIVPSALFLFLCGTDPWYILPLVFSVIPLVAFVLFLRSPIPPLSVGTQQREQGTPLPRRTLALCVMCIFFGGASECTMAQWCSGYLEAALGIEKLWGDLFGVALFGLMLAIGRTLYSLVGTRTRPCLFYGSIGAAVCYLTAVLSPWPLLGLVACAMTGFCVSMLWPGSLIVAEKRMPHAGVGMYALMAAGGDLGASLVPQAVGAIADAALLSTSLSALAEQWGMTAEQLGMKLGMLFAAIFPLACALTVYVIGRIPKPTKGDTSHAAADT